MIIENKEMRVIFFGTPDGKNTMLFRLVPGFNEVKKEHWAFAEKDSIFQHKIKNGLLTVKSKDDKGIDELPQAKAVEVIKNLFDPPRLEELTQSKKSYISRTAHAQLEKILNYGNNGESETKIMTGQASHEDLGHNLSNDRE